MADDTRHAMAAKPARKVRGRPFTRKAVTKEKPRKQVSKDASKRLLAIEERMRRQEGPTRTTEERDQVRAGGAQRSGFDLPVDKYREYIRGFERQGNQTIRVQKRKDEPIERVTFTNFGRYSQLLTKPATRRWESMSRKSQAKLAEYYLRTTSKYLETAKQQVQGEKYPRKLRMNEVRAQRIPMLKEARAELQRTIDREFRNYTSRLQATDHSVPENQKWKQAQVEYLNGLTRRAGILDGIISNTEDGNYSTILATIERPRKRKTPSKSTREAPPEMDTIPAGKRITPYRRTPTRQERDAWKNEPPPRDVGKELWDEITRRATQRDAQPRTTTRPRNENPPHTGLRPGNPRTREEYERQLYGNSPHPPGFRNKGRGTIGTLPASFMSKPWEGRVGEHEPGYVWRNPEGKTAAQLNEEDFVGRENARRAREAAERETPTPPAPAKWHQRILSKMQRMTRRFRRRN